MNIFDLFAGAARRFPEKAALISGGGTQSYSELFSKTLRIAAAFPGAGIQKGCRVGTLMRNCPEFVEILYACHALGAVIVPFNFRNCASELKQQIEYSECGTIFYDSACEELVSAVAPVLPVKINLCCVSGARPDEAFHYGDLCLREPSALPRPDMSDPALMLFTGGTTGHSKLAVHSQRALYNWTRLKEFAPRQTRPDDIFLMSLPMCHSAGLGMLHDLLSSGSSIVLEAAFDAESILEKIEKYSITQTFLIPPSICKRLIEVQGRRQADLSSVRVVSFGGSSASASVLSDTFELFKNARVCMVYSHSERAAFTMQLISREEFNQKPYLPGSVGSPYLGCELSLRDEQGNEVPDGTPGLAYARSLAQMDGYFNGEACFEEGWLNTGDILCRRDGNYFFLSREKDCIKTGGENVFAVELENVIAHYPGVKECAVFGLPDEVYSEVVSAAVIADGELNPQDIILHCRKKLASYKKPRKFYIVDSFPHTPIGKTDKKQLQLELSKVKPDYEITT